MINRETGDTYVDKININEPTDTIPAWGDPVSPVTTSVNPGSIELPSDVNPDNLQIIGGNTES